MRLGPALACSTAMWAICVVGGKAQAGTAENGTAVSTVVVTAQGLNSDGSTPQSGGLYVPAPNFGPLGPTSDKDLPFATSSFTQQVIQDQQTHSAADVLKNDPSVIAFQPVVGRTQSYQVRGFSVGPSYGFYQDGLDLLNDSDPAIEGDERVDVLKGAASVLYGFAAPGGLVQFASKTPLDSELTRVALGYISDGTATEDLDVSRRFGPNGQFGARVNLYQQDGTTPVDQTTEDRGVQAIALDWRPIEGLRLWTNLQHNNERFTGGDEAFFLSGAYKSLPAAPDGSRLYGQPFLFSQVSSSLGEAGLDFHRDGWTVQAAVGYAATPNKDLGEFATLGGDGSITAEPLQGKFLYDSESYRVLVAKTIVTGAVRQTLSVVLDGSTHLIHNAQRVNGGALIETTSLADPVDLPRPTLPPQIGTTSRESIRLDTQFATDKIDFGRYVSLIGGAIRSGISDVSNAVPTGTISSQIYQNKVTPLAALEVHPTSQVTVYASFIQALEEGAQAPSTAVNAFARLPPFIGDQYEIGVKAQALPGLEVNAALFRVDQANSVLTAQNVFTDDGTQRNQGVELTVTGRVVPNLTVIGGVTALTAKIDGANGLGFVEANGVPDVKASLYGEYAIPGVRGLALLAGVYYTDRVPFLRNAAAAVAQGDPVTINIPGNIRVDVGAKYAFVTPVAPLTLSAYVENASNERYFVNSGTTLIVGEPLSGRLTLSANF